MTANAFFMLNLSYTPHTFCLDSSLLAVRSYFCLSFKKTSDKLVFDLGLTTLVLCREGETETLFSRSIFAQSLEFHNRGNL